jgi:hypothetical protein
MGRPARLTDSDHANLHNRDEFPEWDYMPGEDGDPFESKASDSPAQRYRLPMTYVTTVRFFLRCRLSFRHELAEKSPAKQFMQLLSTAQNSDGRDAYHRNR